MASATLDATTHVRNNSGSTLRATNSRDEEGKSSSSLLDTTLSVHTDTISREHVVISESALSKSGFHVGDLVEIKQKLESTAVRDFQTNAEHPSDPDRDKSPAGGRTKATYLCIVTSSAGDHAFKQQNPELSMHRSIANTFGFDVSAQVVVSRAQYSDWTSSHVEICFRDAYLSRSDMWRFASQELLGRCVHVGQKLTFLGSLKATIKNIHFANKHSRLAYFGHSTVPVFRSEAARYVIFVQMSQEMWDFDSEGDGEILFNRVVNGFLPELFKRWSTMEMRHLVSIVMFGRLEYRSSDTVDGLANSLANHTSFAQQNRPIDHQDFYRVVVTDMASAQWTTILQELKKGFRVFLRDVSLFRKPENGLNAHLPEEADQRPRMITGKLSGAMHGNILEAINLAASQFSRDYVDRDLIRTGVSTVVITAGSGVFDVDRELLRLTSETLTNNGVGIDIVCLSKMPLHSVPLFRYRLKDMPACNSNEELKLSISNSSSLPNLSSSPAFSSANASGSYFDRFPSAFPARLPQVYGYGVPQWVDLSYWSSETDYERARRISRSDKKLDKLSFHTQFVPRVRMYEVQMMGLTEMGMAEISIPYLDEPVKQKRWSKETWKTKPSHFQLSRSISRSPELRRKSPFAAMFLDKGGQSNNDSVHYPQYVKDSMDIYDDDVFTLPKVLVTKSPENIPRRASKSMQTRDEKALAFESTKVTIEPAEKLDNDRSDTESLVSTASRPVRPAKAPRNFSYGIRGLIPFKASAITAGVQTDNVRAEKSGLPIGASNAVDTGIGRPPGPSRTVTATHVSQLTTALTNRDEKEPRPATAESIEEASKPIRIEGTIGKSAVGAHHPIKTSSAKQCSRTRHNDSDSDSAENRSAQSDVADSIPNSVPESSIPFIRNVNASNPLKRGNLTGEFGRWQHLYPRKPQAAKMKWRSLCTPASVPLTTNDFPSREELESEYEATTHIINPTTSQEHTDQPYSSIQALCTEMISLRIAHGYQFVTGSAVSKAVEAKVASCYDISKTEPSTGLDQLVVVMTMGNAVQKIRCTPTQIEVTKYVKIADVKLNIATTSIEYSPYLRTILSNDYFSRRMTFRGFSEEYPWDEADHHLAGEGDTAGKEVGRLRYWRARFVLIPVEPPATTLNAKRHEGDENEEEIHLQGIRALSQLWQKNRYVKGQDRSHMLSRSVKRKDEDPLEIRMETLDASKLIAAELDKFTSIGHAESNQLLPESSKLDRDCTMEQIAQAMQGTTGLDIGQHWWRLRSYANSFKGLEFTTWLCNNVKNIDTREEAEEFGNQLMKEGLFDHVTGRHDFRNRDYLYTLKVQYRVTKPDTQKLWLSHGRSSEKSMPATPVVDQPSKQLSPFATTRTRSGSNIAQQLAAPPPAGKQLADGGRRSVALSRMIRIDVDPRKKSIHGRSEVVNVHYDRFHNPDNCYHIELNWLTATCKLVDDAIVTWTNAVERYGLKLVEVPLSEAVDIPLAEPFRNPYLIKLSIPPPTSQSATFTLNSIFASNSFIGPQPLTAHSRPDKHVYQKAILKRFNFVLDFEALSEFPEGVDIQYSWGQLEYKHTQFVHRSGVVLAQIVEDGNIILLANRLYNSRLANSKETNDRMFDSKRNSGPQSHRPAVPPAAGASMQASGIVGVNLASPSTVTSSPGLRPMPSLALGPSPAFQALNHLPAGVAARSLAGLPVMADSFGPKSAFAATGLWNTLITPEQIKDELERFCQDKNWLEAFYKEVTSPMTPASTSMPGSASRKNTGSSTGSLLRPTKQVPDINASDISGIPAFELPESVTAMRQSRRATVAYDSQHEMMDRSRVSSRHGSVGSGGNGNDKVLDHNDQRNSGPIPPSPLRQASK